MDLGVCYWFGLKDLFTPTQMFSTGMQPDFHISFVCLKMVRMKIHYLTVGDAYVNQLQKGTTFLFLCVCVFAFIEIKSR